MSKKHIVVIGLGGVGGYFGFKVNKFNEISQGFHITFVARNQTFHAIKERGLVLHSVELGDSTTKSDSVIENISDIIKPDLVLICVKSIRFRKCVRATQRSNYTAYRFTSFNEWCRHL